MALVRQSEEAFGVPRSIIDKVKDGCYAAKIDGGEYLLIRVSRPESGRYRDSVKIQVRCNDQLKLACILRPDGFYEVRNNKVKYALIEVISRPVQAAADYGRMTGRCCKCGKPLGREPWMSYGIGIDCDGRYPEVREYVEEMDLAKVNQS